MKHLNTKVKMGLRLQHIENMLTKQYTHIWDCCCDHGLLGFNLLKAQLAQTVHFVDIVPELLAQIEQTLDNHWQGDKHCWQVHCLDVGKLPIKTFSTAPQKDTHLIIIAGIGGELMIELLQSLQGVCANYNIEYILCPVHHTYKVRQFLIKNQLALINESLVFENKRGYEIVHVASHAGHILSPVGSIMWDFSNPLHCDYLHKKISHYQRIARNPNMNVTAIIDHYQQLYQRN